MKLIHNLFLTAAACTLFIASAQAQLAITEAMSSGATNLGPTQVTQNSDFWELTNFGASELNLTGYRFDDSSSNLAAADSSPFEGLTIRPGESIVFVENDVNTDAASVRQWWGANLPESVKIVFYTGNGFSSGGDGIRLWGPNATGPADTIDSVDFPEAVRGSSFTYHPETGEFGILSTNNAGGAFKAATTDDVGSPGRTTGPTPLRVTHQPESVLVNPGDTAEFTVGISGRPRGQIQWLFNSAPIAGANAPTLRVTNVQAESRGSYQARIDNGVTNVLSAAATLSLQSEASAPVLTQAPEDFTFTAGQSYTFRAAATGVPQPSFQWQFNGQNIQDATGNELTLSGAAEEQSGLYSVIARNSLGSVTNQFQVTITPPPQLVITEVMSSSSTNAAGHEDFWELTNLGTFPVPLKGYRFDDSSETLDEAFVITNDLVIEPGESVIFVEAMTAREFRDWWGDANLLPDLKIVTYRGNGLSSNGDAVNLWNAAAADDSDRVASAVFSSATSGVSFGFNPDTREFGALSTAGTRGAITAASGGDIGSPGVIRPTVIPARVRISSATRTGGNLRITWNSEAGKNYQIQARDSLNPGAAWTTIETVPGQAGSTSRDLPIAAGDRYVRISLAQ